MTWKTQMSCQPPLTSPQFSNPTSSPMPGYSSTSMQFPLPSFEMMYRWVRGGGGVAGWTALATYCDASGAATCCTAAGAATDCEAAGWMTAAEAAEAAPAENASAATAAVALITARHLLLAVERDMISPFLCSTSREWLGHSIQPLCLTSQRSF